LQDGKTFPVRRYLWDFLKRKQADDNGHFLWIDAICIDQTSVLERNHQVAMMGRIYAEADDVFAWLGVGPENITTAIRRLNAWTKMFDMKRQSFSLALKADTSILCKSISSPRQSGFGGVDLRHWAIDCYWS
jgi:hypothetical protein